MSADFTAVYPLKRGRAHEVCGPGATYFAASCCNLSPKPSMWILPDWSHEALNPVGLAQYCDPTRILLAKAKTQVDLLAAAEEALRSSAMGLVICEIYEPLSLTHGRRLQLAAEAGRTTGLIVMPEGMGSNAAETRWHCTPLAGTTAPGQTVPGKTASANAGNPLQSGPEKGLDSTRQRWDIIKNKSGTLASWVTDWDATSHRVIVVSKTGERSRAASASLGLRADHG
ncbi:hypothetical protein [Thalassovita sp.]|uniref:ImuA family protein n=1 Tax=Thalassovita sp. TaxID=1979401 RepID=UPI002AB12BD5|nr:hypothetical protein [Thalassovita sp.]